MFDFIQNNRKLIQGILFLMFLPFIFFGVDSYFSSGGGPNDIATIGKQRITQQEFNQVLAERQNAIRNAAGGRVDPALLDSPELRFSVLDSLVRHRLLLDRALKSGMTVGDAQLQNLVASIQAFQVDGKFSYDQYQRILQSQGMAPVTFEGRLRRDLIVQNLDDAFTESSFVPRSVAERMLHMLEQRREASTATLSPEKFAGQVKLEADAAQKYYDGHQDEFRIPEQARVAYVALSMQTLMADVKLDPAEVRKAYESRRASYEAKEERQASHILIAVDAKAAAGEKKKALAQAQDIYKQLQQKPDRFAELAKKYSQDPGSAEKGGDLGYFARGAMVPAFDDAVFKLKTGEISAPVETEYGYHIIRVTGARGGKVRSFDEVRGEIEAELRKQRVGRLYAGAAENFNNIVFEQFESLQPAAELAKTSVMQSDWLSRQGAKDPQLNNPQLLQAIFSEDVLKNKRNTNAIEVAPGVLVSARLLEHKPSTVRPFAEVKADIEKILTRRQASQLAMQEGRAQLEALKQGKDVKLTWGAAREVGRGDRTFPEPAIRQIFKAPTAKLPAYTGVESPDGGFTLIRVSRVTEADKIEVEKSKALADGLREIQSQEEMLAFVGSLKQKVDVKVSSGAVAKRE